MTENNTKNSSAHFGAIDGMKGIGACIIAFFWHYRHFRPQNGFPMHSVFPMSYDYGSFMVELFFMLSGFGMMTGYFTRVSEHRIGFCEFMGKRLKKLYPPFLFFTALTVILQLVYRSKCGETFVYNNFDIEHLIYNLFLMQDGFFGEGWSFDAPSWCISICILCYLLFYFILYRVKDERHACYVFFATALLGTTIILSGKSYPIWNSLVGRGISCFSIGAILSIVYKNRDRFRSQRLGYACLAAVIASYLVLRFKSEFMGNFRMAFILGIAPSLILAVLFIPWLRKLLSIRPLTYLGSLSIVIYLVHFPVQCAVVTVDKYCGLGLDYSTKPVWFVYAAAVIVSALIYKLFIAKTAEKVILGFFTKNSSSADTKKNS